MILPSQCTLFCVISGISSHEPLCSSYLWNKHFRKTSLEWMMDDFNLRQIQVWLEDYRRSWFKKPYNPNSNQRHEDGPLFKDALRVSYASTIEPVLAKSKDIVLPVLLPSDFAAFANDTVRAAMKDHDIDAYTILTPASPLDVEEIVVTADSGRDVEGLFLWRINKDLMWQQLDRRIDESVPFARAS